MHLSVQNLNNIKNKIKDRLIHLEKSESPKIIAVSKTFPLDQINPLIESGHYDFGENKVQETLDKWSDIKLKNDNIKLHLVGKLQTNKVKHAVKIFDYIHSVDSEKLAKKIADELIKSQRKIKIFIQVNIGDESQKSGVSVKDLRDLYDYSIDRKLNIHGLMCIPPNILDPEDHFKEMINLRDKINSQLKLSMGMSNDYKIALQYKSDIIRVGSLIFS